MDGNGRWAQQRGLPRLEGHRASRESIRETVRGCAELEVEFLTLYTFSAENWSRPETEVRALMVLIEFALREDSTDMHAMNTRVRLLGDRGPLPQTLKDEIDRVEELTGGNTGMTLQLAINYGGRQEILHAAFALARDAAAGEVSPEELKESDTLAMKRVFLLREVAKKEKIYVTEEEIQKAIQSLAAEQKVSEGEMRQRLEKADLIGDLKFDLMERKVLDHLMKNASLVER